MSYTPPAADAVDFELVGYTATPANAVDFELAGVDVWEAAVPVFTRVEKTGADQVTLEWNPVPGATKYQIERYIYSGGNTMEVWTTAGEPVTSDGTTVYV